MVAGGAAYGTSRALVGRRINLEFVSANPTGPLHAGGGRWVAVGDSIANLLAAQGAEVHREYYLNDAGNQLAKFRDSLYARYEGEEPPVDGYQGQYLVDMAAELRAELGDDVAPDDACEWGYRKIVAGLQEDLGRIGVHFDTWFSERTLHERGDVAEVLRLLDERGVRPSSADGARWLRATEFGDTRDRVLIRSDGTTTYLAQRPRLPPRQVRPGLHPPHRHVGRRPPRPGEVAARRSGDAWATRPASRRSSSGNS